jgi:hypothetical protein
VTVGDLHAALHSERARGRKLMCLIDCAVASERVEQPRFAESFARQLHWS